VSLFVNFPRIDELPLLLAGKMPIGVRGQRESHYGSEHPHYLLAAVISVQW
jgi:hypothetical protein